MPKRDYSKGKIYILRSLKTDNVYVGSTVQTLNDRISGHRTDYRRHLEGKKQYLSSFEIMKYNDAFIELIKDFPCENIKQLIEAEQDEIKNYNCVNINKAYISKEDRAKYILKHKQKWRKENPDKYKEQQKYYHDKNKALVDAPLMCECGTKSSIHNIKRHRKSKKHQNLLSKLI